MLESSSHFSLVVWSVFVAMLAGYTSLDMASRVAAARGTHASGWLIGAALTLGLGIWAMHFAGMRAFSLPIPLGYDPLLVGSGLLWAVSASGAAFGVICHMRVTWARLLLAGVFIAAGIVGLHFMAMRALAMQPEIVHDPALVGVSIVLAFLGSFGALWVAFYPRHLHLRFGWRWRVVAGVVFGLGVAGMHYAAMVSADFSEHSVSASAVTGLPTQSLAALVILATVLILTVTLLISFFDYGPGWHGKSAAGVGHLHHLSLHDALTGLPNRTLLEDRLDRAIEKVRREGGRFALLMIDLDGFKVINDAYGHYVGDRLLLEVAHRVQSNIRGQDTLARLAGDAFVLLMSINEPADAATQAHKVLSFIKKPFQLAGHEIHVSASVGITVCPDNASIGADLLDQVEAARHHAKSSGRNTYSFFEASMHAAVQQQLSLLQEFRHALENDELSLVYQPKLSVKDQRIIGAEALLRWYHPQHGQVSPDEFIPLAERTGLIIPIGEWVLDHVCRQVRSWRDGGWPDASIAVNLSSMQFRHSGLVTTVRMLLKRYGLDPSALTLEVAEQAVMRDPQASLAVMRRLSDLGVRLSIDDFGAGASQLIDLKRLPVDEIKIDHGFLNHLVPGSDDHTIVSAIVALSHTLGFEVVAKGIETPAQFQILSGLACQYFQGFLLGRPMHAQALLTMVRQASIGIDADNESFFTAIDERIAV